VAVVAVIVIVLEPVAVGNEAQFIGFGIGGVVSVVPSAMVVIDRPGMVSEGLYVPRDTQFSDWLLR
jgi:hypothetical protein